MHPRALRLLLIALGLPMAGQVVAAVHDGDLLAAFPGQATETVGFAGVEQERGYAALFEGDVSPLLRLPFAAFGDGRSGLVYGPVLRYREPRSLAELPGTASREALEAGGFLSWRSGPWQLQGRTLGGNPLEGDAGLVGVTGSYALQRGDRLTLVFSGSASYASDDYLQQRTLGDPRLSSYVADGEGLGNLGLGFNASYRFDSDWSLIGMFGVHHTLADSAEFQGSVDGPRFRAGAAFRYDF